MQSDNILDTIKDAVVASFPSANLEGAFGKSRKQECVMVRYLCIELAATYSASTHEQIARHYGLLLRTGAGDHTMVSHARKWVMNRNQLYADFRATYQKVCQNIQNAIDPMLDVPEEMAQIK